MIITIFAPFVDWQVEVRYSTQDSNLKSLYGNEKESCISKSNLILIESRKNWSLEEPLCPLIQGAYMEKIIWGTGQPAQVYRGNVLFNLRDLILRQSYPPSGWRESGGYNFLYLITLLILCLTASLWNSSPAVGWVSILGEKLMCNWETGLQERGCKSSASRKS